MLAGCQPRGEEAKAEPETPKRPPVAELTVTVTKPGEGPEAANGDQLFVSYEGKLADGTVFDRNAKDMGRPPFDLVLGSGAVIEGWEKGLIGVQKGAEVQVAIPYALAYGEEGTGMIPPRSDLFFYVTVHDIIKQGEENVFDIEDVKVGTGTAAEVGDKLTVHYVATYANGVVVDSSRDRGVPFEFTLGDETVAAAWKEGLRGMRVGGVRQLRCPPRTIWNVTGTARIAFNQLVNFEIELLEVEKQ